MTTRLTLWPELHRLILRAHRKFGTPKDVILEPLIHRTTADGQARRPRGATPIIYLRVNRYGRPRQTLSEGTIMATFAHELAHLGAWSVEPLHHGPKWLELTYRIAAWLRAEGYQVSTNLVHATFPKRRKKGRK